MKDKILNLRKQNKTYKEICEIVGCSKSLVSYYCGKNQKEKSLERQRKLRKENVLIQKVSHFKNPSTNRRKRKRKTNSSFKTNIKKSLRNKTDDFQRRNGSKLNIRKIEFSYKDILEHYGEETTCYLTGKKIDLKNPKTYHFDHIVPASKGGKNTFENLGIACKNANIAKSDMTINDFFKLCKEVLEYNGYIVKKI